MASKIVFLPIKPRYAEKLLTGEKRFEFRRRPFSSLVTHIVIYASSPVQRIIGIVEIEEIHSDTPAVTWSKTYKAAGIAESDFFEYFSGTDTAYAIEIKQKNVLRLKNAVSPKAVREDFRIPQSFSYISEQFLSAIKELGC